MQNLTQCIKCVHRISGIKCLAYPEGIPYKIMSGKTVHDQVFDGQIGDYIYIPKQEYIEHDLMLKKEYSISLFDLENLKTEIAQLYYYELSSQEIIKGNWETAKIDLEFLPNNKHGGKFNELSVVIGGNKIQINRLESSELMEKILYLLKIKASQIKCTRLVLTIFPKSPALFEFH